MTDPRTIAAEHLIDGATVHGFTVERHETIEELDACAYVLRHQLSGARLLYLACDDENKAFAIGFKTPPTDSTGVFHILEHSVLCGSAKYPVKEPFVDLIKSSMQTFLNAMTYPDKTIYPVATTNEQDLYNLMDVYMDAVLNPAIYTKKTIFEQEGWHYELDAPEPSKLREGTLRYNGVVFNEMKGALSDPMSVLDDAICAALFPDTAYANESGGDPRCIPTLTYDQFLDTHARHYNLANSYITLYGDLDIDRALAHLDAEYLSRPYAAAERIAAAKKAGKPAAELAPNVLKVQEPVACDYKRTTMVTTPDNAMVGLGYVLGSALDRKRTIAADILFEALLGTNEAPVKKAILASGLGGNVVSYTAAECLQPYELIMLQNAKPDVAAKFREVIEDTCRNLVENGIPRDRLEAIISSNEYDLRQRDYGVADGVAIACDALSTWLYDDDAATLALKYGPVYTELRRELDGTYFEDLLRELVLDADHAALVDLVPVDARNEEDGGASEEAELRCKRDAMTDDELKAVVEETSRLRAAQEAEDSPEAKATLPRLRVSDIGNARPERPFHVDGDAPITCLKHDIPTNRLAYALQYFDLSHVAFDEMPYVSILCRLLKQLPTAQHSVDELDSYISGNLGFLTFTTEVMTQPDLNDAKPYLLVSAGALSEKIPALAQIPREVWGSTVFEDTDRMRDVLMQIRIGLEQTFINAGHNCALSRACSYSTHSALLGEQLEGVDFYRFVRGLLDHFDDRAGALCDKLRELSRRIFCSDGAIASFTGSDEDYQRYWQAAENLGLEARTDPQAQTLVIPEPHDLHEAFVIPSDICFAARALDPRRLDIQVTGAWSVAANALSYDYLWNEIRIKGGAYGCGFRAATRRAAFYTYRDPAIDPSLERIDRAGEWLAGFEPDQAAFEGFIVSCVSGVDAPVKPYALTKRHNTEYLAGISPDERARRRAQMLACTPEKLRSLALDVTRIAHEAPACVFGGREILEKSNASFNVIELLG